VPKVEPVAEVNEEELAKEQDKTQYLGNLIYEHIMVIHEELAPKITGMIVA
jgi:hypothetical protein